MDEIVEYLLATAAGLRDRPADGEVAGAARAPGSSEKPPGGLEDVLATLRERLKDEDFLRAISKLLASR